MTKGEAGKPDAAKAGHEQAGAGQKTTPRVSAVIDQAPPRRRGRFRRFMRSVFSHIIFAALVAVGVFGYFFHAKILRQVGDTICANDMLGRFMTKAPAVAAAAPMAASAGSSVQPEAAKPPPPPAAAVKTAEPAASRPKAKASARIPAAPKTGSAVAAPAAEKVKPRGPIAAPAAGTAPPGPQATGTTGTTGKSGAGGRGDAATLAISWSQARKAYAAGKPGAADSYEDLIRRFPDIPGLSGELGNIYYRQGKLAAAAEQYYETGLRLIRANQHGQAACLLRVLRRLDPAKARALGRRTARPCPARQ